mmetsp:Transcript_26679/g.46205  ORF Transcript_26679/g.46205 Transcript_26679/m.46205 type:complete len:277 (+) Transcript_26679:119-949(+)
MESTTAEPHIDEEIRRLEEMTPLQQAKFDLGDARVRLLDLPMKKAFIKKTYSILILMCFVSFMVSWPWIFSTDTTMYYVEDHAWIFNTICLVLCLMTLLHLVVLMSLACKTTLFLGGYISLFSSKAGIVYSVVYAALFGIVTAMCVAAFGFPSFTLVFLQTGLVILALWFFANLPNADYATLYPYLLVFVVGIVVAALGFMFISTGRGISRIAASIFSIIFGWIVVYDTQLTYGTKPLLGRKYQFQANQYSYAAFEMYMDFFFLFLQKLALYGGTK